MKTVFLLIAIFGFTMTHAQSVYHEKLDSMRNAKNETLKSKKDSPLQKADRKAFTQLSYFEIDKAFNVEAEFTRELIKDTMDIPTSAGTTKKFEAYGKLHFDIDGQQHTLIAYKRVWPNGVNPYSDHESLFVPFTDLTTGEETYGGGRYMDISIPSGEGSIELDFNLCYNPYCAYGSGFSCPIPPKENFLEVEVRAGEKAYDHH